MILLSSILIGVAKTVDTLLLLYGWAVIVAAVVSWMNVQTYHPAVRFLENITEPLFYRVRKALPFVFYRGIDFAPAVVYLAVELLRNILSAVMLGLVASAA
ncbi:MAG: YggT family protein [Desulfovibrionaceae bacterium]|nr:YggT family protein [Desulfovibrionaceae bacterium]